MSIIRLPLSTSTASSTFSFDATLKPRCYHRNGWYKSVVFKWWIFKSVKRFFLCTDCHDLVPLEEFEDIQNQIKK